MRAAHACSIQPPPRCPVQQVRALVESRVSSLGDKHYKLQNMSARGQRGRLGMGIVVTVRWWCFSFSCTCVRSRGSWKLLCAVVVGAQERVTQKLRSLTCGRCMAAGRRQPPSVVSRCADGKRLQIAGLQGTVPTLPTISPPHARHNNNNDHHVPPTTKPTTTTTHNQRPRPPPPPQCTRKMCVCAYDIPLVLYFIP